MAENGDQSFELTEVEGEPRLKERKFSWAKLRHVDSLHLEAGRLSSATNPHASKELDWSKTLSLAFQSIGIVYGDIGTSPLYVLSSCFPDGIDHQDDLLGVLSLILYTLLLLALVKYAFIVLRANDNGEGGTFALYSLLCRYAKIALTPNHQPEDKMVSNYRLDLPSTQMKRAAKIKEVMESKRFIQILLFLVTILGTSMVIGDGVLTPSISVLSAVGGIKSLSTDAVVGVSVVILIILFFAQRMGTDKVGFTFAPIVCIWFLLLTGIGLYNLFTHGVGILRAFNPYYIIQYFQRNGKKGWISLGGVVLCITGAEAMYADLGHFSAKSIKLSFTFITLPALFSAYIGQAAYLTKYPGNIKHAFFDSVPGPLYWPQFVVAVLASIVASQAMISGTFSIISQSLSLGCFPKVKVIHTSAKYEGQVYIPEVNFMLMIACVIVTVSFRTTEKIGSAYGIAVVAVMIITTCMVTLVMLVIWKISIWWVALFFLTFASLEVIYFSAVLSKFIQGGFLPIAFSVFLMTIMGVWHYVYQRRYLFELNNKVSGEFIGELVQNPAINRMPGIGLFYSELVQGIPPIFPHYITQIPSIHSVLVFVSIKKLPVTRVTLEERFLFRQLEPKEYRIFRCVVRYGYMDVMREPELFEQQLVEHLKEFIRHECYAAEGSMAVAAEPRIPQQSILIVNEDKPRVNSKSAIFAEDVLSRASSRSIQSAYTSKSRHSSTRIVPALVRGAEEEMQFVQKAKEEGVVYLLGEAEVVAEKNSSAFKKVIVNYFYSFLRKNFRQVETVLVIPHTRVLRVGMTYEI